jgi:hypothetical protein
LQQHLLVLRNRCADVQIASVIPNDGAATSTTQGRARTGPSVAGLVPLLGDRKSWGGGAAAAALV